MSKKRPLDNSLWRQRALAHAARVRDLEKQLASLQDHYQQFTLRTAHVHAALQRLVSGQPMPDGELERITAAAHSEPENTWEDVRRTVEWEFFQKLASDALRPHTELKPGPVKVIESVQHFLSRHETTHFHETRGVGPGSKLKVYDRLPVSAWLPPKK